MKILLDILLSEEHRMVRESARKFAEKELGPIAKEIDEGESGWDQGNRLVLQ